MEERKLQLGDVQETALIPLSNRATETLRKKPRLRDSKAVEIIRELNIETSKFDKTITHESVIARTIMFDNAVKSFIKNILMRFALISGVDLMIASAELIMGISFGMTLIWRMLLQ